MDESALCYYRLTLWSGAGDSGAPGYLTGGGAAPAPLFPSPLTPHPFFGDSGRD